MYHPISKKLRYFLFVLKECVSRVLVVSYEHCYYRVLRMFVWFQFDFS